MLAGVLRRANKSLPLLLQIVLVVCLFHFMGQGMLMSIKKKLISGKYATDNLKLGSGKVAGGSHGRGSTGGHGKIGTGFSRSHRTPRPTSSTTTTTTTTPMPPLLDHQMQVGHANRLNFLRNACKRWGIGPDATPANLTTEEALLVGSLPKSPLYQILLVSEEQGIAVCPVARAGIQWLSRRLLQATGKFSPHKLLHLAEPPSAVVRHYYPFLSSWEKYPTVLARTVNVLMARHPLDRLLGLYRHLLEDPTRNSEGYLNLGRRIVRMQRLAPNKNKGPTFEEFVRYLLSKDVNTMEEKWQPVSRRCSVCHIPYNLVTHYETLWHDGQWAWTQAGMGALNTTDYVTHRLTPAIRRDYFSQVTLTQVLQLYLKYQLDFEMFGYSMDEHILYAQPGSEPIDPALIARVPRNTQDAIEALLTSPSQDDLLQDAAGLAGSQESEVLVAAREAPPDDTE